MFIPGTAAPVEDVAAAVAVPETLTPPEVVLAAAEGVEEPGAEKALLVLVGFADAAPQKETLDCWAPKLSGWPGQLL
jgi:hypothetical protein